MVPVFIIKYLPNGIIGLLIVAIMSAAMSSLSSTVNSLSAVTLEDFGDDADSLGNENFFDDGGFDYDDGDFDGGDGDVW